MKRIGPAILLILVGFIAFVMVSSGGDEATQDTGDAAKDVVDNLPDPDKVADGVASLPPELWTKYVPIAICCGVAVAIIAAIPKWIWITALVIACLIMAGSKVKGTA